MRGDLSLQSQLWCEFLSLVEKADVMGRSAKDPSRAAAGMYLRELRPSENAEMAWANLWRNLLVVTVIITIRRDEQQSSSATELSDNRRNNSVIKVKSSNKAQRIGS